MNATRPRTDYSIIVLTAFLLALGMGCSAAEPEENGAGVTAEQGQVYSCGMHPHVIEHGPGPCPICGMEMTPIRLSQQTSAQADLPAGGERRILYWVAPMDPTYMADGPGKSPMGMDLVPVYEHEVGAIGQSVVTIDPVVMQNMGVRSVRLTRQPLFRHVRTLGQVDVSEERVSVVNLRFSGWIEEIYADKTGEPIAQGDPLFAIYSPDLMAAQKDYLLAIRAQGAKSSLARSARRKLELFDLDSKEVAALVQTGQVGRSVVIRAPRSGYILQKNVVDGAHVASGQDLYTIADLSHVWVRAEVYEIDSPWVKIGQPARMELASQHGRDIEGSVAYIYPTLNEISRTLTVRLEFPNPDLRLKPGMFATVYIQFQRVDDVLAVPTEAILHSGTRKLVFVVVGEGRFEPREIITGLVGDRHLTEVLSGLVEGDVVVTSGQFLLDSESQLQEAIGKMLVRRSGKGQSQALTTAPVDVVYACPMHPEQTSHEPGRCPICGMDLEVLAAESEGAGELFR